MELLLILFGLVAGVQAFSFFAKARRVIKHATAVNSESPFVSVIVAAHHENENLKELVPILLTQSYGKYEVIIALDRGDDECMDYLHSIESGKLTFLDLQKIPADWNPKKWALNSAINAAKGEWILLTDADCRPGKNWINEMARGMSESSGFVLGISPYQKRPNFLNELIQYETFFTSLEFIRKAISGKPYMGLGRNMAYRKSLFEEVNGFEDIQGLTGGDDDLLIQKMAKIADGSVVLTAESRVYSIPEENWNSYFKQKIRHYSVGKYYPTQVIRSETIRWVLQVLFWGLFGLCLSLNPLITLLIFGFHYTIRIISINIVADRLEKRFNHLWLPFVDLVYSVVLPIISLRSLLVKNVKWN